MPTAAILGGAAVVGQVGSTIAKAGAARDISERAMAAAEPMPQEIAALERSVRDQETVIERERKLIEAVDPALIEAGKQAYDMLKGKETELLGPIRRQRDRQRQVLTETLRRQLGPGFETSSAGMEALSRFDAETNDHLTLVQQNAVGQMLGVAQNAAQMGRAGEQRGIAGIQQAAGMFGNIAQRKTSAILNAAPGYVAGAGGGWDAFTGAAKGLSSVAGFLSGPDKYAPDLKMPEIGANYGAKTTDILGSGPSLGVNTTLPKPMFG